MLGTKTISSLAVAGALGLVLTAVIPATEAEAYRAPRQCKHRVWAFSVQGGHMPYGFKAWIARHKAIRKWRRKTVNRFGSGFRRWRLARRKNVTCEGGAGRITCEVSARPCSRFRFTDAYRRHFHDPYRRHARPHRRHARSHRRHARPPYRRHARPHRRHARPYRRRIDY